MTVDVVRQRLFRFELLAADVAAEGRVLVLALVPLHSLRGAPEVAEPALVLLRGRVLKLNCGSQK